MYERNQYPSQTVDRLPARPPARFPAVTSTTINSSRTIVHELPSHLPAAAAPVPAAAAFAALRLRVLLFRSSFRSGIIIVGAVVGRSADVTGPLGVVAVVAAAASGGAARVARLESARPSIGSLRTCTDVLSSENQSTRRTRQRCLR